MADFSPTLGQEGLAAPSPSEVAPAEAGQATPSPAAEQLYDVKVGGQTVKVPLNELLSGYSRHSDYTKKTQELATRERQYQQQLQQRDAAIEEVRALLSDKAKLEAYMREAFAAQPAAEELLTAAQVQQLVAAQVRQAIAAQQQTFGSQLTQFQIDQMAAQFRGQIDNAIGALVKELPELAGIPGIERLLKAEVLDQRPQAVEDAIELLRQAATQKAEAMRSLISSRQAEAAAQRSPLANRMEPPGGRGLAPAAQGSFAKVNDPGLRDAVIRDLMERATGGSGL